MNHSIYTYILLYTYIYTLKCVGLYILYIQQYTIINYYMYYYKLCALIIYLYVQIYVF